MMVAVIYDSNLYLFQTPFFKLLQPSNLINHANLHWSVQELGAHKEKGFEIDFFMHVNSDNMGYKIISAQTHRLL